MLAQKNIIKESHMPESTSHNVYDANLRTLDGQETSLAHYRGEVLLVVNVASACGLTPQYTGLQRLYEEKRDRGFEVLGFPCNQFGAQEPGTNEQIADFCSTKYAVTFPMFDKIEVNGAGRHPLYETLVAGGPDITWNFEKFLIDRNGNVVERFSPQVTPEDPALRERIEAALEGAPA